MKKIFFTLAIVGACVFTAQAQGYKSAIGLRLGLPNSISFKQFISGQNAVEVFLGYRRYNSFVNFLNIGGLYQVHTPINEVEGLRWYYGGGAAVYFWNYDNDFFVGNDYNSLNVGILGNLGLDYKFATAPVNLSIDWVPAFIFGDDYDGGYGGGFGAGYGALSVRYTFR